MTIVPFRINFRIMLTRSLMRVTSCGKVFNASKSVRLLPSRSPDLNFSQSSNFSAATAFLSSSHSSNTSYHFAHSHSSLLASLQQRISTNQLSQRLCSSSTPPSTPQQKLGELKVEKMQLSYTCKVTHALLMQRNQDFPRLLWTQVCNARNVKVISKLSYTKGVVIVKCDGCKNNHLIGEYIQQSPPLVKWKWMFQRTIWAGGQICKQETSRSCLLNEEKLSGEELFMWKEKPKFTLTLKQILGNFRFLHFVGPC